MRSTGLGHDDLQALVVVAEKTGVAGDQGVALQQRVRTDQEIGDHALAGRRDVRIVQAELGNDAGVLGAAALAFDEHDSREGLHR